MLRSLRAVSGRLTSMHKKVWFEVFKNVQVHASGECCVLQDRRVIQSPSPITGEMTAVVLSRMRNIHEQISQFDPNVKNSLWSELTTWTTTKYFLCSLTLNVYVGVTMCGSSGRLCVLSSLYLWATMIVRTHAKHALVRNMFQSWVGLVLFFLVFTHFKIPQGQLWKSQPEFARLYLYSFDLEICIYFPFVRIECGCVWMLGRVWLKKQITEWIWPNERPAPLSAVCPFVVEVFEHSSFRSLSSLCWRNCLTF